MPPKFQPQPGGFGRRQTPVGDLVGQPLANMREAGNPNAAANDEDRDTAHDNQREIPGAYPEDDFPLGVDAIVGGLAAFGSRRATGPDHVATQIEQWLAKELR